MRLVLAVLVACCFAASQDLPAGVDQLANIDAIIGFPEEFEAEAFAVDSQGAVYIAGTLQSVPEGATALFTTGELHEDNILARGGQSPGYIVKSPHCALSKLATNVTHSYQAQGRARGAFLPDSTERLDLNERFCHRYPTLSELNNLP